MIRLLIAALIIATASATYYGGKTIASDAGIMPDSPLYFFDTLVEKIDIWGTKEKSEKVEKLTKLIKEKISEAGALLEKGDAALAEKALKAGDSYSYDAMNFINSLKSEGSDMGELTENLGDAILKKQEILVEAYAGAPKSIQSVIEGKIEESKGEVKKIVENLDKEANEKLTLKIEQIAVLVDDKIEEAKEAEEKKDLEDLTAQEKKYNIWIEHFYSQTENKETSILAHISRRDPQCSEFQGVLKIYIDDTFYRSFKLTAKGYDDIRRTFDKFYLEKGEYVITGVLEDMDGNKISNKQFKIII
ncbi:DUF5667 domain-containing protein [Candidatus Parcubacteria bacterium]|nr:hypothetical protein [Patescibacteria group bacterium]MCG2694443.1 DUF5667 domain-containing protein [Candidatus Parcubacteria bacterium]